MVGDSGPAMVALGPVGLVGLVGLVVVNQLDVRLGSGTNAFTFSRYLS